MRERILVMDGVHQKLVELLAKEDYFVQRLSKDKHVTPEELSELLFGFDALAVRSYDLRNSEKNPIVIPGNLLAIGRAGAGVDKIPHAALGQQGIVVFNTPGSNANSVKELVIGNLIAASRNLYDAVNWANSLGADVAKTVEKEKKKFKGSEIHGKTLGVIGLGHIGRMVAHDALNLGMQVVGYDPFLTGEARGKLAERVEDVGLLEPLLEKSDYITLHSAYVPDKNKHMVGDYQMSAMKRGVILLNFARGELVDNAALLKHMSNGKVARYVTDFPSDELVGVPNVIRVPHLGASTDEAEENCAIMIAKQFDAYFKRGEIKNSVNYPRAQLDSQAGHRLALLTKDGPGLVNKITGAFSERGINISDQVYHSRDGAGYFLCASESPISPEILAEVGKIGGVIRSRTMRG